MGNIKRFCSSRGAEKFGQYFGGGGGLLIFATSEQLPKKRHVGFETFFLQGIRSQ